MKRILDVVLAVAGLIFAVPFMLVIAVLIRVDSPGSIIFSQKRLGKNGDYFFIHKFRKFPEDWGTKGSGVTTQGDVRMTSFGAILERTKLDELPQLWNILIGNMSFVGPRPESLRYEDLFKGEFTKLLDFTPGIFGPNQVQFRNESEMYPADQDPDVFYRNQLFPQKAKVDIEYFSKSTLLSDIGWMFKSTIGTIIGVADWRRVCRRYSGIVAMDLMLLELAWFIAHIFRFSGFNLSFDNYQVYITGAWLIPLVIFPAMAVGGCYRHPIRYFGVSDVIRLVIVVSSSWLAAAFIQFGFFQRNLSIGISLMALFLFIALVILPRFWRREIWILSNPKAHQEVRNVLIYGAGKKGSALAKFLDQGFSDVEIVGFLDEDSDLRGRHINGLKVFGSWRDRDAVFGRCSISELWVSEAYADIDEVALKKWATESGLKFVSVEKM